MTDLSPVAFDPFAHGFTDDPYPQYAQLREFDPVHRMSIGPWVLSRYRDVARFVRDLELSVEERNAHLTPMSELTGTTVDGRDVSLAMFEHVMFNADPPEHTRLKRGSCRRRSRRVRSNASNR